MREFVPGAITIVWAIYLSVVRTLITFIYFYNIDGTLRRSDWSKTYVLSEYKTWKKRVLLSCARKIYIIKQMKKPKQCITLIKHSSHLRTLGKCRKHSPAARAFYISLVSSNACRVLSQCETRLRLLYLL